MRLTYSHSREKEKVQNLLSLVSIQHIETIETIECIQSPVSFQSIECIEHSALLPISAHLWGGMKSKKLETCILYRNTGKIFGQKLRCASLVFETLKHWNIETWTASEKNWKLADNERAILLMKPHTFSSSAIQRFNNWTFKKKKPKRCEAIYLYLTWMRCNTKDNKKRKRKECEFQSFANVAIQTHFPFINIFRHSIIIHLLTNTTQIQCIAYCLWVTTVSHKNLHAHVTHFRLPVTCHCQWNYAVCQGSIGPY